MTGTTPPPPSRGSQGADGATAVVPDIDYETIMCEVAHGVALVTLNRPHRRNAYVPRMGFELNHAFRRFDADDAVRAIVVTGAGEHFCVGADLGAGADTFEKRLVERKGAGNGDNVPYLPPSSMVTPIIGALNGDAVGVGLTLPLQWDIRLVSSTARLSFAFTRRGTIPEANSHWLLPRLIGASRAVELLLTGRTFTGAEAAEIGMASRALDAADVVPEAMAVARDIADHVAPVAGAIVKHLVNSQLSEPDRRAAFRQEAALFRWAARQPDAKEGVRSFLDKRAPVWTMSPTTDMPRDLM